MTASPQIQSTSWVAGRDIKFMLRYVSLAYGLIQIGIMVSGTSAVLMDGFDMNVQYLKEFTSLRLITNLLATGLTLLSESYLVSISFSVSN